MVERRSSRARGQAPEPSPELSDWLYGLGAATSFAGMVLVWLAATPFAAAAAVAMSLRGAPKRAPAVVRVRP
jgi:hypothetical protein